MRSPDKERTGPSGQDGTGSKVIVGNGDESIVPLPAGVLQELDALAAHVDGAFVVVVKVNGARYRRRCYLTAKSAENAAHKAVARGEDVVIYLAELKPLWRIKGGSGMADEITDLQARGMR